MPAAPRRGRRPSLHLIASVTVSKTPSHDSRPSGASPHATTNLTTASAPWSAWLVSCSGFASSHRFQSRSLHRCSHGGHSRVGIDPWSSAPPAPRGGANYPLVDCHRCVRLGRCRRAGLQTGLHLRPATAVPRRTRPGGPGCLLTRAAGPPSTTDWLESGPHGKRDSCALLREHDSGSPGRPGSAEAFECSPGTQLGRHGRGRAQSAALSVCLGRSKPGSQGERSEAL